MQPPQTGGASLRLRHISKDKENLNAANTSFHDVSTKALLGGANKPERKVLEDKKSSNVAHKHFQPLKHPVRSDRAAYQFVDQYSKTIFDHLRSIEDEFVPSPQYMSRQRDLNKQMRSILVDWMVDVTLKYKMRCETLWMAVNLVDRFLSANQVSREKFQLLGVSALFMAAKYEEIYPPHLKEFLSLCENSSMKHDIVLMESRILAVTGFKLAAPSPLTFAKRLADIAGFSQKETFFAFYILELSLLAGWYNSYKPSTLAAAAVYLCNKIFSKSEWNEELRKETKLDLSSVRPCAKQMFIELYSTEDSKCTAIRRKYAQTVFHEASRFKFEWKQAS